MGYITQEFLDELLTKQSELNNMYEELCKCVHDIGVWESENLGKNIMVTIDGTVTKVSVNNIRDRIYIKAFEYDMCDDVYYVEEYPVSLRKLTSDDWKEAALKRHREELAKREEQQHMKEVQFKEEVEAKERAEYERLKAKFEPKGES